MYPLKLKIILFGILSFAYLLIAYFIFTGFLSFSVNPSYLYALVPYIIIIFGVSIILSPILFGVIGMILTLIIAFIIIAILSATTTIYSFNLGSIILIGLTAVIYLFYKKRISKIEKKCLAVQTIKEASNMVKASWKKTETFNNALSSRLDRYRRLREIGESFSARISLENIYQLAVDSAYEMIPGSDTALLFIVDENQQKLLLASSKKSTQLPKVKAKNGDIFDKWVFKERQPLSVEDITEDFRFDYKPLSGERYFKSLISVPMVSQFRIMGILRLNSREKNTYSFDDLRLLDFISDLASSCINNARLYNATEELSIRDSLTGFYIHRHMKLLLYNETERARLNSTPLSIIMLDIDHFKDYNDKYGHSAGDKVLLGISRILNDVVKKYTQLVARYGGEEFLIILPNIDCHKALGIAEKIRQDIVNRKFVLRREETSVTVSAGVCSYSTHMKDRDDLLKKADFLLYKAKKEGRNKVCAV
jgi:diguanylate cyclase (GGDEF)-like protein